MRWGITLKAFFIGIVALASLPSCVHEEVEDAQTFVREKFLFVPKTMRDSLAKELFEMGDDRITGWTHFYEARYFILGDNLYQSLSPLNEAEVFMAAAQDSAGLSAVLMLKAHTYWSLGARTQVIEMAEQARSYALEPLQRMSITGNLSTYYTSLGDFDKALKLNNEVLNALRELGPLKPSEAYAVRGRALVELYGKSLESDTLFDRVLNMSFVDMYPMDVFNIYDQALKSGYLNKDYLNEALLFAKKARIYRLQVTVLRELRKIVTDEAEMAALTRDLLYAYEKEHEQNAGMLADFFSFESIRQAQVLADYKSRRIRERCFILAPLLLALVAALLGLFYMRSRSETKEAEGNMKLAESALESYKNRIRPHFLFNQLNNVYGFLIQERWSEARDYVSLLSEYLRSLLSESERPECTLIEEVQQLERYAELQQSSSYGHVDFFTEIPKSLHKVMLPTGILQPLVENSFKYSGSSTLIEPYIVVRARERDGVVTLEVEDSGYGDSALRTGTKTGLRIIRRRIEASKKVSSHPEHWGLSTSFEKNKGIAKITMPLA